MSYLVLARKCRPQTFADVVGQQAVVRTLQNAIERNRVPHAMIFSGVRGVGKTTLARIMAKAQNCHEGPTPTPCNTCEACREITAGSAMDLHEIDGASNRGIQEIRELKENIRFQPAKERYKVIIIDEVHMLTVEAFNALLKTLEEPPDHVFFMFATTEQHKIPITILSRCQRYELKRIPAVELTAFFKKISASEGVAVSDRALDLVVREAEGSIRDGLSLLDQVFSFGGNEITDKEVIQVLGLVDREVIVSLADRILAGDLAATLEILDKAYSFGIDLKRFTSDLLAYFRALLICRTCSRPEQLLDLADQELADMKKAVAGHGAETIYHYFQALLKGMEEMRYSSHPRMALEMTFVKAIQAGAVVPAAMILARLDSIIREQGMDSLRAVSAPSPAPEPAARDKDAGQPQKLAEGSGPVSAAAAETAPEEPPAGKTRQPRKKEPAAKKVPALQRKVRQNWDEFIDYVMDRKKWMAHALKLSSAVREEEKELVIRYDDPSDCRLLQDKENIKLLTEFFQDFFQSELQICIKIRGSDVPENEENGSPREERRALANDSTVQMTIDIFNGRVSNIRTGPRSR